MAMIRCPQVVVFLSFFIQGASLRASDLQEGPDHIHTRNNHSLEQLGLWALLKGTSVVVKEGGQTLHVLLSKSRFYPAVPGIELVTSKLASLTVGPPQPRFCCSSEFFCIKLKLSQLPLLHC